MIELAKTLSSKIVEGLRLIKVIKSGKADTRQAYQSAPHGIESAPAESEEVVALYSYTEKRGEPVIVGYLNKRAVVNAGETKVYSTDAEGEEQIAIKLTADGKIKIAGDSDFAVRFTELEKGFKELKDDLNSFVKTYNSHTHPFTGAPPGGAATTSKTTQTGSSSSAEISDAKVEDVQIKGK